MVSFDHHTKKNDWWLISWKKINKSKYKSKMIRNWHQQKRDSETSCTASVHRGKYLRLHHRRYPTNPRPVFLHGPLLLKRGETIERHREIHNRMLDKQTGGRRGSAIKKQHHQAVVRQQFKCSQFTLFCQGLFVVVFFCFSTLKWRGDINIVTVHRIKSQKRARDHTRNSHCSMFEAESHTPLAPFWKPPPHCFLIRENPVTSFWS